MSTISNESRAQLARVARGGAVNLLGAAVSATAGFALVVVVTNRFDSETAGSLFSTTSMFLVVIALAVFGTDTGLAHFMFRYEQEGRGWDIPTLVRSARLPVAMASTALAGVAFIMADQVAHLVGAEGEGAPHAVRILALAVPLSALSQLALSETRALGRMRPTVVVDNVLRAGSQPLAALLVAAVGGGLVALTVAWVVPFVFVSLVSVPVAQRIVRRRSSRWSGTTSPHRLVFREFWRYTAPRGVARFSQIVIQRADIILIAALVGATEAAVYTAATRFVIVGQMATQAMQAILQPRFSLLLARRDMATVADVFKIATAWSIVLAWPFYTAVAAASGLYLGMFGDGYRGTAGTVVVITMSIGMMMGVAAGPIDTLLLMSGRSVASLVNAVTAAIVNVMLCFILIPTMGIPGAAVAWASAVIIRNGLTFVQVRRSLQLTPFSAPGAVVAVAAVACYALPVGAMSLSGHLTLINLVAALTLGTIVYLLVLWRTREPLALSVLRSLVPVLARCRPARG